MESMRDNSSGASLPELAGNGALLRRAALLTAGTGLSRLLGFVRDVLIAHFLGAGLVADVFLALLRLPTILRRLLTEGGIAMPFMPAYFALLLEGGEERAAGFARAVRAWVLALSTAFCALGLLFPLPLLLAFAPGLAGHLSALPDGAGFAAELMQISLPYVPFILLSCVNSALLQSKGNYLAPALAPCILNICFILPLFLLLGLGKLEFFAQGPQSARLAALALVWALPLAGVAQALYLGGAVRQSGFSHSEKINWRDGAAARFAGVLPSSLCVTAAHQIAVLIAVMAASFLAEGYITQVHFADQLIELPLGVFGMALAVAALPDFSALAGGNKREELRGALKLSLGLVSFVALPAAAGLFGLARPVVALLFGHGAFSAAAVDGCAALLSGYALGLPALAALRPLIAAIHALRLTKSAAKAALLSFAATACAAFSVVALSPILPTPEIISLALGLAVSSGALVFFLLLWRILGQEKAAPNARSTLIALRAPLLLSLGIAALCKTCAALWPEQHALLPLILVPLGIFIYGVGALALKCPEAGLLLAFFRARRDKGAKG